MKPLLIRSLAAAWHAVPSRGRSRRSSILLALFFTLLVSGVALAQNPAALQLYFVPLREDDALISMQATNSVATAPVYTYISVAIGTDGTFVYYDQWENGFDADIANPTDLYSAANPDGTQVWGNGIAADGCPPNRDGKTPLACTNANDVLEGGNVIVLSNAVDPTTLQSVIDFDGGDKIGATKQIAASRLYWPQNPRTLLAGAIELLPTSAWGLSYISPVGEDVNYNDMFEYTSLAIMAYQPNTQVTVDVNGAAAGGTQSFTLQPGQSRVVDNVLESATVDATYPVQVHLLTADRGSSYEHSAYTLSPTNKWGSRLYSPVGVTKSSVNPTRKTQITIFNPLDGYLSVRCNFRTGSTTIAIAPESSNILEVPNRSGAECVALDPIDQPFFAISTVDAAGVQGSAGETWDWGFTLVPDTLLSPQALVGLGLGRDPTSTASPNQNGSPVWITPVCEPTDTTTYVFVDLNGDGTADRVDLNGDNDTSDTVDGISESSSNLGMLVSQLQSVRLFDPVDRDQTGMLVSTRSVPNFSSTSFGCDIAAVWGEDPDVASQGEPGFDVGTSVPPLSSLAAVKTAELTDDADGDGYVSRGDTLTYAIQVENTGIAPIVTVLISDSVPFLTTYLAGTATYDLGSGPVAIPDNIGPNTPFPLDQGGFTVGNNMPAGAIWTVRYSVRINTEDPAPEVCNEFTITNTAFVNGDEESLEVQGYEPVDCAGTLVVEKVALGGPPVPTFAFTATAEFFQGGPNNELPTSGTLSPPPFGSDAVTYSVPTGIYTITELITPGWDLIAIGCSGTGVGNVPNRTATYLIQGDDVVRCTFTNTIPSQLVVSKLTVPPQEGEGAQRFLFDFLDEQEIVSPPEDPNYPGVPVPPIIRVPVLSHGESVTFTVLSGSYRITENVPSGWALTDITCDSDAGQPNLAGNAARYTLAPGERAECTFTNSLLGTIIVEKLTVPAGDPQQFTFTGAITGTIGHGEVLTRSVAPGTYTVGETLPTGWQRQSIVCDDNNSTEQSGSAQYVVEAGETVTCTFTNLRLPVIAVEKATIPAGNSQQFTFSGAIAGTIGDGGRLQRTVAPGSYSVSETLPAGWRQDGIFCDDPGSSGSGGVAQFVVEAGDNVTCTFTNLLLSEVGDRAWSDLNNNGIQDPGEPGLANVSVELFLVDPEPEAAAPADTSIGTQTTGAGGTYLFTDLEAGNYYLIFEIPDGYTVSPQNVGSNPAVNSKIDATGRTPTFALPVGTSDLTRDAGFYSSPTSDDPDAEPDAVAPIYLPVIGN